MNHPVRPTHTHTHMIRFKVSHIHVIIYNICVFRKYCCICMVRNVDSSILPDTRVRVFAAWQVAAWGDDVCDWLGGLSRTKFSTAALAWRQACATSARISEAPPAWSRSWSRRWAHSIQDARGSSEILYILSFRYCISFSIYFIHIRKLWNIDMNLLYYVFTIMNHFIFQIPKQSTLQRVLFHCRLLPQRSPLFQFQRRQIPPLFHHKSVWVSLFILLNFKV